MTRAHGLGTTEAVSKAFDTLKNARPGQTFTVAPEDSRDGKPVKVVIFDAPKTERSKWYDRTDCTCKVRRGRKQSLEFMSVSHDTERVIIFASSGGGGPELMKFV